MPVAQPPNRLTINRASQVLEPGAEGFNNFVDVPLAKLGALIQGGAWGLDKLNPFGDPLQQGLQIVGQVGSAIQEKGEDLLEDAGLTPEVAEATMKILDVAVPAPPVASIVKRLKTGTKALQITPTRTVSSTVAKNKILTAKQAGEAAQRAKQSGSVGDVASTLNNLNKAKRLKLTRTDEVLKWIDEGNEFIRKTGSQKNWKNKIFTDSDGNQWQLKSQGTGKDAKPRSMEAAARDAAGRKARENAWRAQLKEVLERRGTYTPERYKELSKRVTSQINKMKTHIRNVNRGKPREEWISFGHKKSLEGGGINVPENVVFEPYLENVSTQHKFDPSDAAARQSGSPLSVEEWVLQQEILEEFGDILPYRGLPNDLQIKILKTKGQAARDALVEAYLLEKTKIE